MKLLMITGSYPPSKCGVGTYVKNLTDALDGFTDVEVHVLTNYGASMSDEGGVYLHNLIDGWGAGSLYRVYRLIKEIKPDIVHVQYPTADYAKHIAPHFIPVLVRLMRIGLVQTWHEYFHARSALRNMPNALMAKKVLHLREGYYESLPALYKYIINRDQLIKVSQGCNIPKSSISNERRAMLRNSVTEDGKQIVTHFGYIGEHKNVHMLFELLDPDKYFIQLLCELHEEREYDQKILKYTRSDEWCDSVNVSGYLPSKDVADYISISDAVVFLFTGGVQLANTSYLAALNQGVFVVASSTKYAGFNEACNTYFLNLHELNRLPEILKDEHGRKDLHVEMKNWAEIAREHMEVYKEIVRNTE